MLYALAKYHARKQNVFKRKYWDEHIFCIINIELFSQEHL